MIVGGAVSRECEWMTYYYSRNGFCLPFLTCPPVYVLWDYRRCSVKKCIVDTPCKRVYFFSPLHCCVAMPWPALIHAVYSYRPAITVHIRYIQFAFMLYRYYYNYNTLYSKKINFLQLQKNIDDATLYFKFFKKYCKNLLTVGTPTVILALQSKTGTCKGALSPALSLFFSPRVGVVVCFSDVGGGT